MNRNIPWNLHKLVYFSEICGVGNYYSIAAGRCIPCEVGYFQDEEGQFFCKFCERGQTTSDPGAVSRSQCQGLYLTLSPLSFSNMFFFFSIFSSPEHEVLMVSYCGQSMSIVRRAASTIALKAYSSYTPGPIDLILGRKHQGDL